jgi:DNA repair protein RadC
MKTADKNPLYLKHRERLRTKYRAGAADGWQDYELLEFALTYTIPQADTKPAAKRLIERFKDLAGVLDADSNDLEAVSGVGPQSALFLKFLRDLSRRYAKKEVILKDLISSPGAAVRYLDVVLKGAADEEFHALFLNAANRLLAAECLQKGTVNRSAVYPRKIVERALHLKAVGVILAHNHPGGTTKPSDDDLRATQAIKKALDTLEIGLLDHIIISKEGYFSWKEQGLL